MGEKMANAIPPRYKCQVLRITNKRKPIIFNYTLHDHILATVTQAKYLGLTITNDLNWKQHVENITKSANISTGIPAKE